MTKGYYPPTYAARDKLLVRLGFPTYAHLCALLGISSLEGNQGKSIQEQRSGL